MTLDYRIEPNGNLTFLAAGNQEDIQHLLDQQGGDDVAFLKHWMDHIGLLGNNYDTVRPEDIGALTDAPILGTDVEHLEDGTRIVHGQLWWFPDYMVKHFGQELLDKGQVTFPLVH